MFGRMTRRMQDRDCDVAEFEDFSIARAMEGKCYVGSGEQNVRRAGGFREAVSLWSLR